MKKSKESLPDRVKKGSVDVLERLSALDSTQLHAVLATDSDGQPYTSMIAYVLAANKKEIIFSTPGRTQKYKNILKNNRVSLLIDTRSNTEKDYMGAESLTVLGHARPMRRGRKWSEMAGLLIKKHPALRTIIHSPETKLISIKLSRCIHVSKFQTVSEWISK